jgi:hypothetical protein
MEMSRLDVPLSLELDYGVPSRLFQGCIVTIGLENISGGIKAHSNYLIPLMVPGITTMIYCTLGFLLYLSTLGSYKLKRCYALYVQYEIVGRKGLRLIKDENVQENQVTENNLN